MEIQAEKLECIFRDEILSKIAGAPGIIWATSILLAITTIALGWQVLLLTKRSPIKIINQ